MEVSIVRPPEKAQYRLLQPFYVSDIYIPEEEIIEFDGVPNESMEPLNEAARERMTTFLRTLPGGRTPRVEDAVYTAMQNRPREGDVQFPQHNPGVPPMPNTQIGNSQLSAVAEPPVKILPKPSTVGKAPIKVMGSIVAETTSLGESLK